MKHVKHHEALKHSPFNVETSLLGSATSALGVVILVLTQFPAVSAQSFL